MAVNPVSGKIYVTNAESRNVTRFEGPGIAPDDLLCCTESIRQNPLDFLVDPLLGVD